MKPISTLDVAFYTAGVYQVICSGYSMDVSEVIDITVYNPETYSIASPSPVSGILTVSFNPELVAQVIPPVGRFFCLYSDEAAKKRCSAFVTLRPLLKQKN